MLRVADVAERLGVSVALVYELAAKGKISSYRIGLGRGALRFKGEDVETYLQMCRVEGETPSRPVLKHIKLS
jgi:excisionase family DNA binding protein